MKLWDEDLALAEAQVHLFFSFLVCTANSGPASPLRQAPRGFAVKLWDEDLTLAEAQVSLFLHCKIKGLPASQ